MSEQEINRLQIIESVKSKRISQIEAAHRMKLSDRQLRRLIRSYEKEGAVGLISKQRGKASNRQIAKEVKQQALLLLKTHYADFGPTFAHEKLCENHKLKFSVETLRKWMIEDGIWKGKRRRMAHVHQTRERRAQRGELVQIDGSLHDWFEGRRGRCCLLVFIDDATSELLALHFVEQESLRGYFDTVKKHITEHGLPLTYYSDKHSIFRVQIKEAESGTGETQLGRALSQLGIELLCANTPQAKGRVEKANQTLQDRLVKELRLRAISDINTANAFLPAFIQEYNRRFAVSAINTIDAHRRLEYKEEKLNLILAEHHTRVISKNLQISYQNVVYQIQAPKQAYTLRKAKITVCDNNGAITLLYKGRELPYKTYDKNNQPASIVDSKEVQSSPQTKPRKISKPNAQHPWRKGTLTPNKVKQVI